MEFDQFVRERGRTLWRSAYLLTGDRFKAEDLVQTALTKTYPKYTPGEEARYEAYLRTTMYNTFVSWWRRRWNSELPSEAPPEHPGYEGSHEISIDVLRALATLPKQQRAVLVLRYFEDRTVTEVSQMLGISEGTVKSYAHRGCAALRESHHLAQEVIR